MKTIDAEKVIYLRMLRQHFLKKIGKDEYINFYHDVSPVQSVYWDGFGQPPTIVNRTTFNDTEFNRERQKSRELLKGRLSGNIGWIEKEELELFIALYKKPIKEYDYTQSQIQELIDRMGPLNIQQIKEETGLLVKEITPSLHKLQEAFILYEDQYDGEWDRSWHLFKDFFPGTNQDKYTKLEALKIVLKRFAYRNVLINSKMAKSFYRLVEKDIKKALEELREEGTLLFEDDYYFLKEDKEIMENIVPEGNHLIFSLHRNDFLVKSFEPLLKEKFKDRIDKLEYDHEVLQYLLIDGEFSGVSVGHFRYGPNEVNDIICVHKKAEEYRNEIIEVIKETQQGSIILRYNGEEIK